MSVAGPAGSSVHEDADTRLGLARVLLRLAFGLGLGGVLLSFPTFFAWTYLLLHTGGPGGRGTYLLLVAPVVLYLVVVGLAVRRLPPRDRRWVAIGVLPWCAIYSYFATVLLHTPPR
ncbi:MAG: hypothetical protein H6828_12130 [Planctomycetes bacterium]|nr:hypothetical protein [Planctomycetota bacterium]